MRANEFLIEFELPKNKWELVVSNGDKEELGTDLVSLVRQAYSNTPQGSFVNSIKDVIPSDWNVIDWDQDPDVDSCVFYRKNRGNENWQGYKLQGLGHDGTRTSKDKAINKIQELLARPGVWIESSDAMRHVLKKLNVPAVTDERLLQQLFNDPNLKMIDDDTYVRVLSNGTKVTETVFGNPKVRATEFVREEAKAAKYNGLVMKYAFNNNALILKAFTQGTPIAYVKFVKEGNELYPQDLWTHDVYRNKGVAKSMYDYLKSEGYEINRSHDQTKAGAGFWDKHRGEDQYVWEEINPDILNPDFEHKQQIGDFIYTAKMQPSASGYFSYLLIRCYKGSEVIGKVNFEVRKLAGKHWLESQLTYVDTKYHNKGIASTMYAYAKMLGNDIKPSKYQSDMGKDMWAGWKKSGAAKHLTNEELIDEMPLPADWDPQQFKQQSTTFKSRLAYALERAKKLGTGSSRVATVIEYEGRPTVLKIAKNTKGLAQNGAEASILDDGYASQLGILIPLIDYDTENRDPLWIHTEMATKANEKQLCSLMKCESLQFLVNAATSITGKKRYMGTFQNYVERMQEAGSTEDDIEIFSNYANILADLNMQFDVELGDFTRAANWGLYQGKPVIVDVGFTTSIMNVYYKR